MVQLAIERLTDVLSSISLVLGQPPQTDDGNISPEVQFRTVDHLQPAGDFQIFEPKQGWVG